MNIHAGSSAKLNLSQRISSIGVSEILQIGARAAELKRSGRPIIVLGAGEPDFDTPDHIKDAAAKAMQDGQTKYTNLDGTAELKSAIQRKFSRDNRLDYQLDEISVGTGAKQILYNAFMATLNPGDEVIIPTPYWVSYSDIVQICGGKPVLVPCAEDAGFRLVPEALERAITPRTRWLILNSPSNPSGTAYGVAHYQPLLDVLLRHPEVWLLADDIYEHIVYDGLQFVTPVQVQPLLKSRALIVNGVSKAYAMTGWRIGYGAGPKALVKAMSVVQSQATSCPSSVSQAAAVAALNGPHGFIAERTNSFQKRRDLVVNALNKIPGLRCRKPEGAFYVYVNCYDIVGKMTPLNRVVESDSDFARFLLDHHDVAVVPGSAFGLAPYFRISYAASETELTEAMQRIAQAVQALR